MLIKSLLNEVSKNNIIKKIGKRYFGGFYAGKEKNINAVVFSYLFRDIMPDVSWYGGYINAFLVERAGGRSGRNCQYIY